MLLKNLLKSERILLPLVKILFPIPLFGRCVFYGASSRESVGVGVAFITPTQETISLSYKLEFETTNNVA
jgi:hypothetical protein